MLKIEIGLVLYFNVVVLLYVCCMNYTLLLGFGGTEVICPSSVHDSTLIFKAHEIISGNLS